MTEILRLKNDKKLRDRFFVADAMSHPAKGHIGMWESILERYTQLGDWVLDPMAGIGTTLMAALMGRNVICVELEPHFVEPMCRSWAKMQTVGPMLGCELGQAVIIRGDARCLPLNGAEVIVTSPPYEEHTSKLGDFKTPNDRTGEAKRPERERYGYTRPVDAVVSSPSYGGTNIGRSESLGEAPFGGPHSQARGERYAPGNAENIGNLRGQAYWDSMALCYQECFRVLRPGGVMALVLKGFTRDGKYVDLPSQTAELVESLGFRQFDHWKRELWSLSFWRILQRKNHPETWDDRLKYEEVLAFRREEIDGVA